MNKDASEERNKDIIAEKDLTDLIAVCLLQIVCRYIEGYLLVVCSHGSIYICIHLDFSNIPMLILLYFRG